MSCFQISESSALQSSGVETPEFSPQTVQTVVLEKGKYQVVLRKMSSSESEVSSEEEEVGFEDYIPSGTFNEEDLANFALSVSIDDVEPKKKQVLKLDAKPFIPQFHSNMTIEQVGEIATMEGVTDAELLAKKYPKYLIARVRKSEVREVPLNPFRRNARERNEEVEMYSSEAPSLSAKASKVRSGFDVGEVAKVWVVPNRSTAHPVCKPTRYHKRTFLAWCLGKAHFLYGSVTKRTQVVTGNSACRALYFDSGAMNQRVADQLLQKAEVYMEDFGLEGKKEGNLTLGHFSDHELMHSRSYFMIGNTKVSSVEEAVKFEPLFKRHGPIFRRLIAALQGDVTVDVVNLQATINQKVLPPNVAELLVQTTYQGKKRTLPVEVISKSDGTVITTELQGNLCPRRVALGHKFVDSEGVDRPLQLGADVRVSFDVSSVTNIFSQPMLMGESMIRMSAKIVSFIMALLTSKDWKNTASIVTLFVSSDPSIFAYVGNKVSNALTGVSVFQGTFENIFQAIGHTLSEFWHVVVSSTILAMLKECKDSLFSVVGPVVFDLVKETKRAIGRETATNIAKTLFAWIGDILGRLKECVRTRSMKPIWGDRWNANTWIRHSLSYERFYVTLTTSGSSPNVLKELASYRELGFIPDFWVTPKSTDDFLNVCEDHLVQGDRIKEYFAGHVDVVKSISMSQAKLSAFMDGVRMSNGCRGERIAPMGFFISGAPGVGKTNLVQQMIQSLGRMNNMPHDGKSTHLWQVGVNFQDGLNHTHTWIVMDDIDAGVAPAAAGVPTHVESVINLINHKPCPVEQADLSLKGKVFTSPCGVFYVTNFNDGRAPQYSLEPHAYYRRFKYFVTVVIKDEYAKEGGLLDVAKATDSNSHDMYDLYVCEYKPSSQPTEFKTDPRVMSFPEFMKLCQEEFSAHIARETKAIQRRAAQTEFCPTCGLSTDKACGHMPILDLQGDVSTAPVEFKSATSVASEDFGSAASVSSNDFHTVESVIFHDVVQLGANSANSYSSDGGGRTVVEKDFFYQVIGVQWLKDHHGLVVNNVSDYRRGVNFVLLLEEKAELPIFEELIHQFKVLELLDYCYCGPAPELGFPKTIKGRLETLIPKQTWSESFHEVKRKAEEKLGLDPITWSQVMQTFVVGCVGIYALQKLFTLVEHISEKVTDEFQGREANVNSTAPVPTDWQRADQKFKPGVPASFGQSTYTLEDLEKTIGECYVAVTSVSDGQGLDMHGTVVAPGWIAVPTHLVTFGRNILVKQNGVEINFTAKDDDIKIFPSNNQLCLLRVPNLRACPSLAKKMWFCEDGTIQQFDAIRLYGNGLKYSPTQGFIREKNISRVIQTNVITQDGDCGMLYVACHNGAWKIVGMHYALETIATAFASGQVSIGGLLTGRELIAICQSTGTMFQGVQYVLSSFSKTPDDLQVGRFGKYSEVWAAKSQSGVQVHPYGEMTPPLPNSSMKSKVKLSVMYPYIKEIIAELCGREDYWKIPQFRGRMEDGIWRSPFTNMFVTQNLKSPDPFFMKLAVYDYVNGIDLLDRSGYAVLSEEQMMTGIPGSFVNAINMKTSAGPPLKGGKRAHFFLDSLDGSYASPEIWEMFDRIDDVLSQGDVPVVLSVCAMKDEPLKYSKEFPRIFNVLPAAMNLVMKKYGSAWKSFMRANFQFFESAVGINMTSKDCNKVLEFMKLISPDLSRLFDADAVAMDKSWSEPCFEFVAITIFIISCAIGVAPKENFSLTKSMCYTVYSIKNDLFNVAHNPSGNDWTVELNGILISLGERFVYYRTNGFTGDRAKVERWFAGVFENPIHEFDPTLTFRSNVALATYGDDNTKAMKTDPAPNYEEVWAEELGIVMTDASKLGRMRKKTVSEISFLKRDFVTLDGIEGYVAKLSKFSMGRMLMMKKDSTLGDYDHCAVVLSEFFREALYHGREFYEDMLARLVPVADELGLLTNPYYDVRSFDERLEEAKEGNYQTWSLREPVPRRELITLTTYQGIMSNLNFANGSNFDPSASSADTTITHSVGTITTSSSMVQDHMVGSAKYLQNVPVTELNSVLTRATLIGDYAISNGNAAGSDIAVIDPWDNYLANGLIASKLENFSYIRGTLQLIFVTTVPGMTYGLYTVTALPNGGPLGAGETAVALGLTTVNALQGDHCAMINCCDSNSVVLQLPYLGNTDMWAMPGAGSPTPVDAWKVYIRCFQALNTTVSGGVTTGRVQVYANLLDDYVLAVPRFQGKHKLVANDALKKFAPAVHKQIGEGKGSKMMGAIADVAESASSLPVIGAFASTAGAVARGAESVLSWFGFTVYSNEQTPKYMIPRSIGNVAHTEGDDGGFSASLSMQSEISIDPSLNGPYGPNDCLSFAEVFPRWTLVKTITWPTTAVSQDDLGIVYVSPFYGTTSSATTVHLTTAGFVGLPFEYWRGDMEYQLVIPVASTHRGKLQVFWSPQGSLAGDDVTNISYNAIFDVSAGPMKEVTVGFARERPFLKSSVVTDNLAIIPIGDCNGALQFRVVNPLTSSSATAGTNIFVFARAKQNMEFAVPRDAITFRNVAGSALVKYTLQAHTKLQGALGDDDGIVGNDDELELVPSSGDYPSDLVFFGEKVKSCRELLQKPSKLVVVEANSTMQIQSPFPLPQSTASNSMLNVWTWQGHYRAMFYGLSFSERWKCLTYEGAWVGAARGQYEDTFDVIPTMSPLTYTGTSWGSEFRLPFYHNEKFLRGFVSSTAQGAKQVSKLSQYGTVGYVNAIWYYSWGPDIRATCFRQVPGVQFTETPITGFKSMW